MSLGFIAAAACLSAPAFDGGALPATSAVIVRASETVALTPKAYRTWRIELPRDPFQVVSGSLPIPHAHGQGFAVEVRGNGLAVDTDGDGQVDRVVEGVVDPTTKVQRARVNLSGKTAEGVPFTYPVRLEGGGGAWKWAPGGALEGVIGDTEVCVIDLDGNGRYGDVGRDAIVVGDGDVAQLLGEAIHVDGELVHVEVDAAGATLAISPFEGATGTLDLRSALAAKGVLLAAVVVSEDGRQSFELSGAEDGARVPAGRYRLQSALLGLGEARVSVDAKDMAPIEVASGRSVELAWGAPIQASFEVQRSGGDLVFDPAAVQYVGRAGERWIGWDPAGKSPTFRIKEKETGDVLVDVVFPGSC
ncbi:MAG: hypothetical protein R3F49_03025 [Planctomycetota bacterium]